MATNYKGFDLRGRPLTENNIQQYLIDSAAYYKAVKDFGIQVVPDYANARPGPVGTQIIPNKVVGDIAGATRYLEGLGLIAAPPVTRSRDPFTNQTIDSVSSRDRQDWFRRHGQNLDPSGAFRFVPDALGTTTLYPNGGHGFDSQIANIILRDNAALADPNVMRTVLAQKPEIATNAFDWVSANAAQALAKEKAKDKGGLGVIAEGLGQVAQFAGLASGLHGLTAGIGALTSGAGLGGAFDAGMAAAGGMTDIGGVIGNIVGNPAIGNIANVGQAALTGGYQGGTTGALIGAGGATIGAGIGEAGGIGEFLADPLGSIGGAFNVAAGGGVGGLLNIDEEMASAAQVGPNSLASNTPPVTGPIAYDHEIVTVTASPVTGGAYSGGSYGFLASTLANLGVPAGANLQIGPTGNLEGYTVTLPDGNIDVVGLRNDVPPDFVNNEPTQTTQGGGAGAPGNLAGGPVQSAPGNVEYTGQTVGPNGQPVYEYTITGSAGPEINIGAGGLGSGAGGAIAGAITGGATTGGATTGGATTGGGLLDASVTPTTPGGTTGTPTGTQPTLTDEELAAILAGGAIGAGIGGSAIGGASGGAAGVTPGTGMGTTTGTGATIGTGPTTGMGTGVTPGTGMATGQTGTEGGLSDAELAALLTGGVAGVGLGLGGADTGMATATGTGVGTTGVGTGAGGVGTGTGAGGTGTGGTGDGSGFGNGLDLLFPQMQGLLEMGFQPGTEADFGQYGPVGSIIKAGKSNIPQTPKRKKRGIRVNISGRARNA